MKAGDAAWIIRDDPPLCKECGRYEAEGVWKVVGRLRLEPYRGASGSAYAFQCAIPGESGSFYLVRKDEAFADRKMAEMACGRRNRGRAGARSAPPAAEGYAALTQGICIAAAMVERDYHETTIAEHILAACGISEDDLKLCRVDAYDAKVVRRLLKGMRR